MANDFLGPVNPNATAGSNDEWWTNAQTQNAAAAGGPQYTYAQPGPWAGGYVFDSPQPGAGGDYYVSAPWSPAPADTPIYDAQTPQLLPADNPATPWDPWAQFNAQPGAGAWNDPWQPAAGSSGMGVGSGAWNDPLTGNGPQANGWGSPYSVPLSNPPLTPFPLASSGNGAQAPDWMAAPDTWLGQQERNIFRPDANLIERGGAVLGAIGGGLGALAQGVEGLLGGIGSNLPRVKTSPMLCRSRRMRWVKAAARIWMPCGMTR